MTVQARSHGVEETMILLYWISAGSAVMGQLCREHLMNAADAAAASVLVPSVL